MMNHWADSIFDKMTTDERIGQLFMIVADPGNSEANTKKIIKYIKEQKIGGILFSKGQLSDQAASTNLYQKESKIPLLISLDGEWGLSMRLEDTPRFPKNIMLGAIGDNDLIRKYGQEVARECKEMGIHINFAPVLDVNTNPSNPVIGSRSFGELPSQVSTQGIAYSLGLESEGIISVAKHFPGHGSTSEDSHKTLPEVRKTLQQIESEDLVPFIDYINAGLAGVMSGHLYVPALDKTSEKPTSLSPVIITDLLQDKLHFNGLKFTDALVMKGASSKSGSICVDALLAGNDVLLSPANPVSEFNAVKRAVENGTISIKLIEEKCRKILRYKYISGLNNYKPIETKGLKDRINSENAQWLISKLCEEAVTLLKNDGNNIPVTDLNNKKIAVLSFGESTTSAFQKMLKMYGQVDCYNLSQSASGNQVTEMMNRLRKYDTIICAIHHYKITDYLELQKLIKEKETHLCFFISPYYMSKFRQSIRNATSVTCAYENIPEAQNTAAEIIMGGIPSKGKLPVSISDIFKAGDGLTTQKTRLSYQLPQEAGLSSVRLSEIDKIAEEGIKEKAYPGCQVLVAKNGIVVYNKSFGYFDYARTHPVEDTDVYDLASVTKAAATVPAIMKLYDEKKIKLNDKLSTYVSSLSSTDKKDITIRKALFHETGLTSFIPFYLLSIDENSYTGKLFSNRRTADHRVMIDDNTYARTDYKFKSELVSNKPKPDFSKQVAENFYVSDDFSQLMLEEIANSKLKTGGKYLYSDLNFILLKEATEKITGEPFDLFLEKDFYGPLGANYMGFKPLEKIDTLCIAPTEDDNFLRNQILIGYPHDEAAAFMGGVSGNAGLFSNANDLAKLSQMLLNLGIYGGERLLSTETCKLFTETKSNVSRRGLGFDKPNMENEKSSPTGNMAPASTYGHTGFTGTCFWIDPENQIIFVFLSNRVYPNRYNKLLSSLNIRSRIQNIIYYAMNTP